MMKKQQGFSLIELLIVVGIIGALTAIAVPAFQKYKEKSDLTAGVASLKAMRTAIDISISENSADFPADLAALQQLGDPGLVTVVDSGDTGGTGGTLQIQKNGIYIAQYTRNGTTGAWACTYNNKTSTIEIDSCANKDDLVVPGLAD